MCLLKPTTQVRKLVRYHSLKTTIDDINFLLSLPEIFPKLGPQFFKLIIKSYRVCTRQATFSTNKTHKKTSTCTSNSAWGSVTRVLLSGTLPTYSKTRRSKKTNFSSQFTRNFPETGPIFVIFTSFYIQQDETSRLKFGTYYCQGNYSRNKTFPSF